MGGILKRVLFLIAFSLVLPNTAWARGARDVQWFDPKYLDCSKAKVSLAGPDKLYIRSLYYAGEELSVLWQYDGMYGFDIYGPYFQEDKLFQDSDNMDYVQIRPQGNDSLAFSNMHIQLIVKDGCVSGIFKYAGGAKYSVASYWETTPPMTKDEQIALLNGKIEDLETQIVVLRKAIGDYEKQISMLEER